MGLPKLTALDMSVEYVTNVGFGPVLADSTEGTFASFGVSISINLSIDTDFFIWVNNVNARRNSPASPNVANARFFDDSCGENETRDKGTNMLCNRPNYLPALHCLTDGNSIF